MEALLGAAGVPALVEAGRELQLGSGARRDARRLVKVYTQWAARLAPGMEMDPFVARVESLGSKREVAEYMFELRESLEPVRETEDAFEALASIDPQYRS